MMFKLPRVVRVGDNLDEARAIAEPNLTAAQFRVGRGGEWGGGGGGGGGGEGGGGWRAKVNHYSSPIVTNVSALCQTSSVHIYPPLTYPSPPICEPNWDTNTHYLLTFNNIEYTATVVCKLKIKKNSHT